MRRKAAMLARYDQFVARMTAQYAEAREALERGEYTQAHDILARMGISHARTSMSLRNVLIRSGRIQDGKVVEDET